MSRKIGLNLYKLLSALILTPTLFIPIVAQTQEKAVAGQSQIYNNSSATGQRISGTVKMNPDGQPIAGADVEIREIKPAATGMQIFASRTRTNEQGRWTIDKVPEGDYLIVAGPGSRLVKGKDGWFKEIDSHPVTQFVAYTYKITMSGTDIDNFAIQVIKGGRISGKIVMDGGDEPIPEGLIVLPEQASKDGKSRVRFTMVQPDGSFVLEGVPVGDIFLKAVVFGKPKDFSTKSATVGSIDLLRETLHIKDGSEVKNVQIVFAKAIDNK